MPQNNFGDNSLVQVNLSAIRQQASIWANAGLNLGHHMTPIGHNESTVTTEMVEKLKNDFMILPVFSYINIGKIVKPGKIHNIYCLTDISISTWKLLSAEFNFTKLI